MGNRTNKYIVKVTFDKRRPECNVGTVNSHYPFGQAYEDEFSFHDNHFILTASRSKRYPDGSILSKSANTINTQLVKGLLFYYAIAADFPRIKNITITLRRPHGADFTYTDCDKAHITQPLVDPGQKNFVFREDDISIIFDETDKGRAMRIALSYWITGIATKERYYRFDRLWRSFNRLFLYHGNTSKEFNGMTDMRQFIINHPILFPQTLSITDAYTSQDLRSFNWRQLILNDYDTPKKTQAFHDFILRYSDVQIMDLFDEMLPYRDAYLTAFGLKNSVTAHIAANRNPFPIEKIPLLSLKYAYFVRNKMFHGEIPDSTFKVHTDENDILIDRINAILSSLIFELLSHSDCLR